MQIIVNDRQSLLDIAIQCLGGADGIFSLAERNGIGITDLLKDGQVIEFEMSDVVDSYVQNIYNTRGISPATDITENDKNYLISQTAIWKKGISIALPKRAAEITNIGTQMDNGTSIVTNADDGIVVNKAKQIIDDLNSGKEVVSETGQTLARIFTNQFNDVFE